jgi:hypothetical protein
MKQPAAPGLLRRLQLEAESNVSANVDRQARVQKLFRLAGCAPAANKMEASSHVPVAGACKGASRESQLESAVNVGCVWGSTTRWRRG